MEKNIEKFVNKILNKEKIKNGFLEFLKNSKEEAHEYKEAAQILNNYAKTGNASKEDIKKVRTQLIDTLKISSSLALFILPGGSLLLAMLITIGNKFDINFLPSSFSKKS